MSIHSCGKDYCDCADYDNDSDYDSDNKDNADTDEEITPQSTKEFVDFLCTSNFANNKELKEAQDDWMGSLDERVGKLESSVLNLAQSVADNLSTQMQSELDRAKAEWLEATRKLGDQGEKFRDENLRLCMAECNVRIDKIVAAVDHNRLNFDQKYNELVSRFKKHVLDTDEQIKVFTRLLNNAHERIDKLEDKLDLERQGCSYFAKEFYETVDEIKTYNKEQKEFLLAVNDRVAQLDAQKGFFQRQENLVCNSDPEAVSKRYSIWREEQLRQEQRIRSESEKRLQEALQALDLMINQEDEAHALKERIEQQDGELQRVEAVPRGISPEAGECPTYTMEELYQIVCGGRHYINPFYVVAGESCDTDSSDEEDDYSCPYKHSSLAEMYHCTFCR